LIRSARSDRTSGKIPRHAADFSRSGDGEQLAEVGCGGVTQELLE
jgi:hypothetical protein